MPNSKTENSHQLKSLVSMCVSAKANSDQKRQEKAIVGLTNTMQQMLQSGATIDEICRIVSNASV